MKVFGLEVTFVEKGLMLFQEFSLQLKQGQKKHDSEPGQQFGEEGLAGDRGREREWRK